MIPYGRQSIDDDDVNAVVQSLRSDWLTQGPAVRQFEQALAGVCQVDYAVACNSGTAALHMAYYAAGVGVGDVVVVPANTFLATANAAIYLGADVRFCDVDPQTGLMTAETLAAVLDDSVKAVVPVHFSGQACDMEALANVVRAKSRHCVLIEDASHALGGVYASGEPIGSPIYSSMITFSFHPVKHIAAGEGGAVTTSCPNLKSKLEIFRCHGMTKVQADLRRPKEGSWYYEMHEPGFNYRIPDISCALACSQLSKLGRFLERRREIASTYFCELNGLPGVQLPSRETLELSAWHLFCLHIDFEAIGQSRQGIMQQLLDRGVGTQVHYFPVPLQPYYENRYGTCEQQFPGAVSHYQQALSIPMFPAMSDSDLEHVVASLRDVFGVNAYRRRLSA
jgi:UDP-4-amino-4,6-dideoxy-N-acetyl-beta-L-altrosamine transaminase